MTNLILKPTNWGAGNKVLYNESPRKETTVAENQWRDVKTNKQTKTAEYFQNLLSPIRNGPKAQFSLQENRGTEQPK